MRAQAVVGLDCRGDLCRVLRPHALVHVFPPVAVRPAIEGAFLHGSQIVGNQVGADLIAFIHDCPQLAGARLDGQRGGIAQTGGVRLVFACAGIDTPHAGPVDFRRHAAFGDVAIGADAHVQVLAIGAGGHGLGPVVVDVRWQRRDGFGGAAGLALPWLVVESHHRVLVGDVEVVVHQGQAIGRVQVLGERQHFVVAVAVGVAQQGQAVAALYRTGAPGLDDAGDHVFGFQIRGVATLALGHQDVAVGQDQRLPWDFQIRGDGGDRIAVRHGGGLVAPWRGFGNDHIGQQPPLGLG
ncbi:hypothetical protein D3C71_1213780 [compost metagenome]